MNMSSWPDTPTASKSRSRRNLVGKPSPSTSSAAAQAGVSKDPKTPARSKDEFDVFDLFCDKKSTKKTNSSKRTGKTPKTTPSGSSMPLSDILKDYVDEPVTLGTSFIAGVFDKWMEEDPYAPMSRFLPGDEPESPDRPLTLFSPVNVPRASSVPLMRPRARRALDSPSGKNGQLDQNKNCAREEMLLGATPLSRKQLDPYSPCHSYKNPKMSTLNGSGWSCDNKSGSYSLETPSCSTPLQDKFKTPTAPVNRPLPFTGEPLSKVRSLLDHKYRNSQTHSLRFVASTPALPNRETPTSLGSGTPVRLTPDYSYYDVNTPGGLKSTVLFGSTCYVEVRYQKEDRSEWVRKYVAAHGAKVEKNFTKKVTHVIFKEGKISTYMKAKASNIPIVSLLWIDACRAVGGLVDPLLHPPSDDDKYQKEMPLAEDRKRRRLLRSAQAFLDRLNGILPPKPLKSRTKKKPEPSATEGKRKKKAAVVNVKKKSVRRDTTAANPETQKTTRAAQPRNITL